MSDGPGRQRILIINQAYSPDPVATAQVARDLAVSLVDAGHDVGVLTSRSLYGEKGTTLRRRESLDGVDVIRTGHNLFGRNRKLGRLVDFSWFLLAALFRSLTLRRYDVVISLTTPPYLIYVGLVHKLLRRSRVVYWLMDLYPEVLVADGVVREGRVFHRVLRRLHRRAIAWSDVAIALGRCMEKRLVAQGAEQSKIEVVPLWPLTDEDSDDHEIDFRRRWEIGDRLLVMYSGTFGIAHDVTTMLEAAERLEGDDRICFAFVGGGERKAAVDAFVAERGLGNVVVSDPVPLTDLRSLLRAGDIHLVTIRSEWWGLVVPSKFAGVAGVGRGTIFIGPPESEVALSIEESGCGLRIEPGDVDSLVATLSQMADDRTVHFAMGEAARRMSKAFSRASTTSRITAIVEGVANTERS